LEKTLREYPAHSFGQVLQRLPPHARRKWHALIAQADDAEALLRLGFEREKALAERRDGIVRRLAYLDVKTEGEAIADIGVDLEVIDGELRKLSDERERRDRTRSNVQQVLSQLRDVFIPSIGLDLPNADARGLLPVNVEAAPAEGESLLDAVIRVRSEVGMLKSELQWVKAAPPAREEIEAALREEVQRLIFKGTPSVSIVDGKIVTYWPDAPTLGGEPGQAIFAPSGSASALLAALFPDEMYKMLSAGLDQLEGGISADERVRRIAELERQILQAEHVEESLVEQALAAGLEVHRRPSMSGWALLGIMPPMAAERMMAAE
jgi:hypothetical protein